MITPTLTPAMRPYRPCGSARALMFDRRPEVVLSGPAGTGKSRACLEKLHLCALKYPGTRALIVRKTRESLTESALVTFEEKVLPEGSPVARGPQRRLRQAYRYPNRSEVVVGGLDKPSKVMSTEYDLIYVQEAIELNEDDWESLTTRLRNGVMPFQQLIADTNPDAPTHWLKVRADAGRCVLLESRHEDNPAVWDHDRGEWTPAGAQYIATLERLTGVRFQRLRHGLWVQAEGAWFPAFDRSRHTAAAAEYDPAFPVTLAIDCGTSRATGAVFFQVRRGPDTERVTVFGDHYAEDLYAAANATALRARAQELCGGHLDAVLLDPASNQRTGVGPVVYAEYVRVFGERLVRKWPGGPVADGLDLIETFVASDPPGLLIHPRCVHLVSAFENYARAKRGNQWMGFPEDPQHPYEDLMDPLRGGLRAAFPSGRRPAPTFRTVPTRDLF
jgi:hypothetical protein